MSAKSPCYAEFAQSNQIVIDHKQVVENLYAQQSRNSQSSLSAYSPS
jgi:hypothetical protein